MKPPPQAYTRLFPLPHHPKRQLGHALYGHTTPSPSTPIKGNIIYFHGWSSQSPTTYTPIVVVTSFPLPTDRP